MEEYRSSSDESDDLPDDDIEAICSEVQHIREELNLERMNAKDFLNKWEAINEKQDPAEVYCMYQELFDLMINIPYRDITSLILNSTPFIVNADMLLIHLMADRNWNMDYGGQMLHLVYLCERFLQFFVQKGGKCHIIFFTVWKKIFERYPMMHLARLTLSLHFKNNSNFEIYRFNSVSCPKFMQYLSLRRPPFMLLNLNFVEDSIAIFDKSLFPEIGLTFYTELFTTLSIPLPCVDMSDVKLDVSTLNAFYVSPADNFEKIWFKILDDTESHTFSELKATSHKHQIAIDREKIDEILDNANIFDFVACLSCAQILCEDDIYDDFVRSYLLYVSVVKVLPLKFRACDFESELPERLEKFIQLLQHYMNVSLVESSNHYVDYEHVADIWQGNLFCAILHHLNSKDFTSVLNDCSRATYNDLVYKTCALVGRPLRLFPIIEGKLEWPIMSVKNNTREKHSQTSINASSSIAQSHQKANKHKSKKSENTNASKATNLVVANISQRSELTNSVKCLGETTNTNEPNIANVNNYQANVKTIGNNTLVCKDNIIIEDEHLPFSWEDENLPVSWEDENLPVSWEDENLPVSWEENVTFLSDENVNDLHNCELELPNSLSSANLQKLLPVSCELLTFFCSDLVDPVYVESKDAAILQGFINRNATFDEKHHWHSKQPLTDELDRTKDHNQNKVIREKTKYYLINQQRLEVKYKSFLSFYGRSLEGDAFYSKPIVCKSNKKESNSKSTKSVKALKIIEENQKGKILKQEDTDRQKYELFEKLYDSWNRQDELVKAVSYLSMLQKNIKSHDWLCKVLIFKAEICYRLWKSECESKSTVSNRKIDHVKNLFLTIRDTLHLSENKKLSDKYIRKLGFWLHCLGFKELCAKWTLPVPEDIQEIDLTVGMSYIRFQLAYLGPDLKRETGAVEDARVENFQPDKWQRDLFDIIDKKESALIVAPTSSGKTYASYYCMQKVLEESNDGVVVYVSPTKALVNQVHATVYARFRNKVMPPGKAVVGVFTRDYRNKAMECQILITVPQCLEMLLLSPRQHDWSQRLRYIIFDEVHCLAGQAGGVHWERCLLLIRCPFLALSATVGEPENFYSWLQSMEHFKEERDKLDGHLKGSKSYKVHLVQHFGRHSDLLKYIYTGDNIHEIHPYSLLDEVIIKENKGIPSHISLSPKETLQLYDVLNSVCSQDKKFKKLHIETFFSSISGGFLTRNVVREYQDELRKYMEYLATHFKEKFRDVKLSLSSEVFHAKNKVSFDNIDDVVKLIDLLQKSDMLPAIFFLYNRDGMELLFEELTDHYEKDEFKCQSLKSHNSDKNTSQVSSSMIKKAKDYTGAPVDMCCAISANVLKKAGFVDQDYKFNRKRDDKFSHRTLSLLSGKCFLKGEGVADESDVKFIEQRLIRAGFEKNDTFVRGLRLGLGIHHGGKSAKERGAVEMLFRMGLLRCVFATGTLALGIHMPCKSVVILGDSQYINALEYHQMSGRAGRRGFDTFGNVIFVSLPQRRLRSLMTDNLPSMIGNFPLNVGTVLRLLLLVSRVTSAGIHVKKVTKDAISRVLTLLNCSMAYQKNPQLKLQMKHFFQFSTQLLVLQGFLDENGSPQDLTGIVTHLHYHEPGNLAIVYLFRSGALRKLCKTSEKRPVPFETQMNLVLLLSYLFGRIPLHSALLKRKFNNSKVVTPDLPDFIKKEFREYNKQVRFLFDRYFRSVSDHCLKNFSADNKLPLTNVAFGCQNDNTSTFKENSLEKTLVDSCVPRRVCSAFAAMSGNDDSNLYSDDDLISNIRHEVFTDIKIVPLVDYSSKINGYACDFYNHGIASAIRKDNGLKAGEDFTKLKDFLLVLKTLTVSLEELQPKASDDPVLKTFKTVLYRFSGNFQRAYNAKAE